MTFGLFAAVAGAIEDEACTGVGLFPEIKKSPPRKIFEKGLIVEREREPCLTGSRQKRR